LLEAVNVIPLVLVLMYVGISGLELSEIPTLSGYDGLSYKHVVISTKTLFPIIVISGFTSI